MDALAQVTNGRRGRVPAVEGLLGRLLGRPSPSQPLGEDDQQMQIVALQTDGIPFGFTRSRPTDVTGTRPAWYEFGTNAGDIDDIPQGVPMRDRHFKVPTR